MKLDPWGFPSLLAPIPFIPHPLSRVGRPVPYPVYRYVLDKLIITVLILRSVKRKIINNKYKL